MVQIVVFINLFLAPVLPLYILYQKRKKELKPTLELLFQYCMIVVCNIPLAKIFTFSIRKLMGISISLDSGFYTIIALLPTLLAVAMYYLYLKYRANSVLILNKKQKIVLSIIVSFFFSFTIMIFTPYDLFFGNQADFAFSFSDFWWIMATFGLLVFAVLALALIMLPTKISVTLVSIVFSLTVCSYIQRMFLNLYITSMTGEALNTGEHPIWRTLNLIFWFGAIVGTLILLILKAHVWKKFVKIVSVVITFIQAVALVSLLLTENLLPANSQMLLTRDGIYEVASDNNILVFILDYYDYSYYNAVKNEDPDFYNRLEGFTYFDNTTSVYSRSYPSNTYLLTGLELPEYHINPYEECIDIAFSTSDFLPDLKELGFDVELYTMQRYVGNIGSTFAQNYSKEKFEISYSGTVKSMLKSSMCFLAPYILKPYFWFYDELSTMPVQSNVYSMDDALLYENMVEEGLSVRDGHSCYKYIHLHGGHPPYTLDENFQKNPQGVEAVQQWKSCVNVVCEYLEQMKALGVYDNATIIITSDHGAVGNFHLENMAVAPILFVKPAGAALSPLKISHSPVSHTDILPTIIQAAGGNYEKYGTPIFEISEESPRKRIFHCTSFGNHGESEIIDYEILGDVKQFENWRQVSSKKVLNSMYAVEQ